MTTHNTINTRIRFSTLASMLLALGCTATQPATGSERNGVEEDRAEDWTFAFSPHAGINSPTRINLVSDGELIYTSVTASRVDSPFNEGSSPRFNQAELFSFTPSGQARWQKKITSRYYDGADLRLKATAGLPGVTLSQRGRELTSGFLLTQYDAEGTAATWNDEFADGTPHTGMFLPTHSAVWCTAAGGVAITGADLLAHPDVNGSSIRCTIKRDASGGFVAIQTVTPWVSSHADHTFVTFFDVRGVQLSKMEFGGTSIDRENVEMTGIDSNEDTIVARLLQRNFRPEYPNFRMVTVAYDKADGAELWRVEGEPGIQEFGGVTIVNGEAISDVTAHDKRAPGALERSTRVDAVSVADGSARWTRGVAADYLQDLVTAGSRVCVSGFAESTGLFVHCFVRPTSVE